MRYFAKSNVSHTSRMSNYCISVRDEGAFTPYEANLCLLLEWTEGTALRKIRP